MTNDHTRIEWTDATWNPTTGCSKVSDGCRFCYAEAVSHRWGHTTKPWTHPHAAENVVLHPERLDQPLRWRKPRRIFVDSMSDLFHERVPDGYIDEVFAVMALAKHHTFQLLTKRPERMRTYVTAQRQQEIERHMERLIETRGTKQEQWNLSRARSAWSPLLRSWPLPNVWLGTSVEDQRVDDRITDLVMTPAAVRFLSCEPLIGPLDLWPWLHCGHPARDGTDDPALWRCVSCGQVTREVDDPDGPITVVDGDHPHTRQVREDVVTPGHLIDWVIVGGESGSNHRPLDLDWVRAIRDDCQAANVPFFFKQVGGRTPKAGGRELDGRTWDAFPLGVAP